MNNFVPSPNPKGEREYTLRKRFENEWNALGVEGRRPFIARALEECKRDKADGEYVAGLIFIYAWTLFAESCDPAEAKRIANGPFVPMSEITAAVNEEWSF